MSFFFFNDTATTEIYTLSLHDALPIYAAPARPAVPLPGVARAHAGLRAAVVTAQVRVDVLPRRPRPPAAEVVDQTAHRSEEHTSELQSRQYLVCRLLLEKKKNNTSSPN